MFLYPDLNKIKIKQQHFEPSKFFLKGTMDDYRHAHKLNTGMGVS